MFTLLGFSFPVLLLLPVEMLAEVFRNLDSESLVNVMLSSTYFMKVCKGDPILRRRVRAQLLLQRHTLKQTIMNPNYGLAIFREGGPKMFGKNVVKTIQRRKLSVQTPNYADSRGAQSFSVESRKFGGGKVRTKTSTVRVEPYKHNIRC
ncbi:hypothetical protein RI129_011953 [Pyrocoelia pectoralis]|uniref:F-box domain-containing protein n=1 Tax=Pyrocoelia pectoralis TaxID=417401 RepID=A0AAN7V5T4_9COLE